MEIQQRTRATHHQRRAAKTMTGAIEKIQLFFVADFSAVVLCKYFQSVDYFFNIILYQLLGTRKSMPIQSGPAHASHIAMNTFIESEEHALDIVSRLQTLQSIQSDANRYVIVLSGLVSVAPAIEAVVPVIGASRLDPLIIAASIFKRTLVL